MKRVGTLLVLLAIASGCGSGGAQDDARPDLTVDAPGLDAGGGSEGGGTGDVGTGDGGDPCPRLPGAAWSVKAGADNAALVLNAEANAVTVLDYTPQTSPPFKVRGPLAASSKPQLPIDAVMVRRGALEGRVLITENTAIRQVDFKPSGEVVEAELFALGSGYTAIPGAIGVQP